MIIHPALALFLATAANVREGPAVAPAPRPVPPAFNLADWTPRPATGKAEPWEKATDPDWIDARFREMNTGPFLNCTMDYPLGKGKQRIYKATVVKLGEKGDAGIVFDRGTMQLAAAWTGWLQHSDRRFGLLNTPIPKGDMLFAMPSGPGWADPKGKWDAGVKRFTAPLPREWVKYRGMYLHGDRVVFKYAVGTDEILESPTRQLLAGKPAIGTALYVPPHERMLFRSIADFGEDEQLIGYKEGMIHFSTWGNALRVIVVHDPAKHVVHMQDKRNRLYYVRFNPTQEAVGIRLIFAVYPKQDIGVLAKQIADSHLIGMPDITKPGPRLWGEPIITPLVRGSGDGPFAVDTLTIPYKNRFNALFFCTGVDFLPDGRVAVCTCHGDVWLVTVDEKAATCSWQRFATGLYQPLGLKVVDGKVVVLERGQLTRLHDRDGNGEADFYECINNDWHTGDGQHSFDTCLETDPDGNFFFFKTGDTDTPTGGCLMKVSKDGKKSEIFCTGFRHPIGLGMSPTGIVTGADQEGNWMPATRIDEYRKGGFYGDMRAHHREVAPEIYDGPLCWVPREVDNSAGGQVWVPPGKFRPLAGLPLHFSYGRCRPFVLLRQELANGTTQGGVAPLDITFLSGVCRGRFHPTDGHLYVCGLNGWQTAAKADGCLQRVRNTGKPLDIPVAMKVQGNSIRLTFSRPLDAKSVADPQHYRSAWWNYRWSGEYGSKRWKVSNPDEEGQDDVPARMARLLGDGRTVEISFDRLEPVMQMQVGYNMRAADGKPVVGSVFLTIHSKNEK